MKKQISFLIFLGSLLSLYAQPFEENAIGNEKVESLRIAFLTRKLSLTPDEAQKFWPVYYEYKKEMASAHKPFANLRKGMDGNLESMSDSEADKFADEFISMKRRELDLMEAYHKKFKQVMSPRKVAILYKSEREFRQELLKEMRSRKEGDLPSKRPGAGRN